MYSIHYGYKGLRKFISICGNLFAKSILDIKLNEITTYFRVYSIKLLKKLPFNELNAQGYSLGVRLVWLMKKLNANLIEVPIHFRDRNKGKSKILSIGIILVISTWMLFANEISKGRPLNEVIEKTFLYWIISFIVFIIGLIFVFRNRQS